MIFSKSKNGSQPFTMVSSVLYKMSTLGLAACLLATGCSQADQPQNSVETPSEEQPASEQAVADNATVSKSENQKVTSNTGSKTGDKPKPVSYDVESWQASENQDLNLENLDQLKQQFGKVIFTDEKSLDYASNMAVKYRFMEGEQPYLDIIDSDNYLEFGWYYANPNDSDSEKKMSVNHAQKVYKVMTGLMGEEGGELVKNILSKKIVKNTEVGGQMVELAKCEFYSCMIILDKNN